MTIRKYVNSNDPSPFMGEIKKMSFHADNMGMSISSQRKKIVEGEVRLLRSGGIDYITVVPTEQIQAGFSVEFHSDNGLCLGNESLHLYLKDREGIQYFNTEFNPYYLQTLNSPPIINNVWDFFCPAGLQQTISADNQGLLLFDSGFFQMAEEDSTYKVTWWDTQYGPKDSFGTPAGYFSFREAIAGTDSYDSVSVSPIRPTEIVSGKVVGIYNVNKRYYFKIYSYTFDPSKVSSLNGVTYEEGKTAFRFSSTLTAGMPSFMLYVNVSPPTGNSCGFTWFLPKSYTSWRDFIVNGWEEIENNKLYKMSISLRETIATSAHTGEVDTLLWDYCASAFDKQKLSDGPPIIYMPEGTGFEPTGKTLSDIYLERAVLQTQYPTWTYEIAHLLYATNAAARKYVTIYDYLYQGPWPYRYYYHTVSLTEMGAVFVAPDLPWFTYSISTTSSLSLSISPNNGGSLTYLPYSGDIVYRYLSGTGFLVYPWVPGSCIGPLYATREVSDYTGLLYNYIKEFGAYGGSGDITSSIEAFGFFDYSYPIFHYPYGEWAKPSYFYTSGEVAAFYSVEDEISVSATTSITSGLPTNYYKSRGLAYGTPWASFWQLPHKNML